MAWACQGSGVEPAAPAEPRTKATCHVCGREYTVRLNGRMPIHSAHSIHRPKRGQP